MAGMGRNYPVLKKKFKHIEMLDASVEMMKANTHPVIKHKCYIEKFNWPRETYHCIIGVSSLCYLQGLKLNDVLTRMDSSLAEHGYMVFMEPIDNTLGDDEQRDFAEKGQKMKIRSQRFYK